MNYYIKKKKRNQIQIAKLISRNNRKIQKIRPIEKKKWIFEIKRSKKLNLNSIYEVINNQKKVSIKRNKCYNNCICKQKMIKKHKKD